MDYSSARNIPDRGSEMTELLDTLTAGSPTRTTWESLPWIPSRDAEGLWATHDNRGREVAWVDSGCNLTVVGNEGNVVETDVTVMLPEAVRDDDH